MQVETFECYETAAEPIEATEEAVALMEKLGLSGQMSLVKREEGKADKRCPYREITAEERFVYKTLCPEEYPLTSYKATPVPLRVLQIAAHASELGLFKRLIVWDKVDVSVKDPVLIAMTDPEVWYSDNRIFILARWGEVLETFAVLKSQALTACRAAFLQSAEKVRGEIAHATDDDLIRRGGSTSVSW